MLIVHESRRGSLTHTNSRVLILTTIILYVSTATYVAALMWNRSQAHHLVLGATNRGLSPSYDGYQDIAAFEDAVRKQSWMAAVALEVNVCATVANTAPPLIFYCFSASSEMPSCGGARASSGRIRP